MRLSKIAKKLSNDQPVLIKSLHLTDPSVFELTSLMGFDGIWIDLEHHAHSLETVQNLMRAARIGTSDIIARPAKGEFMRMGRLLEAGAQGIMYPRCDNAAEAAEVVKWAKFPPFGKRGCDGGNPDMPYCSMPIAQYVKEANEQTFVIIQVEEEQAIDNVEEIAAVDGVDIIMLGPGDYSCLSGFPGQMDHPQTKRATERIAAAALRSGKQWGRPTSSPAHARELIAMGARFIAFGSDPTLIKRGWNRCSASFSPRGSHLKTNCVRRQRRSGLMCDITPPYRNECRCRHG
jgi:4-hydroxy-2-oxoheptanedioate aldolase